MHCDNRHISVGGCQSSLLGRMGLQRRSVTRRLRRWRHADRAAEQTARCRSQLAMGLDGAALFGPVICPHSTCGDQERPFQYQPLPCPSCASYQRPKGGRQLAVCFWLQAVESWPLAAASLYWRAPIYRARELVCTVRTVVQQQKQDHCAPPNDMLSCALHTHAKTKRIRMQKGLEG